MNQLLTYTLVLEYNYVATGESLGSVWLFYGDGTSDLTKTETMESMPGWLKIIGPVDYEIASDVQANLKVFFERNGQKVIDKGIAD
ncbi:MAG TPA: hypothetical protein VGO57_03415 [Verrucomicrobiae bacterium]|jgi:hypothetical protein